MPHPQSSATTTVPQGLLKPLIRERQLELAAPPIGTPASVNPDLLRPLTNIASVPSPVADPASQPFLASLTAPDVLRQQIENDQDQNRALKTLEGIADVLGLKSTFEVAVTLRAFGGVNEPIKKAWRKLFNKDIGKATTGDFVVAGITLFGGLGLKGALTLSRNALRAASGTISALSDDAIRSAARAASARAAGVPGTDTIAKAFASKPVQRAVREIIEETPEVTMGDINKALDVAIEVSMKGGDLARDVESANIARSIFNKLSSAFAAGEIDIHAIPAVMRDFGFVGNIRPESYRTLFAKFLKVGAEHSDDVRSMAKFKGKIADILTREEAKRLGIDGLRSESSIFRKLSGSTIRLWRAAITSQLATAMRNVAVGGLIMPLRFIDDIGVGAVELLKGGGVRASFRPALENATAIWRQLKPGSQQRLIEAIETVAPGEGARLFQSPYFDMIRAEIGAEVVGGKLVKPGILGRERGLTERVVNVMQVFNRTQEYFVRSIVGDAAISSKLARMGLNFDDAITRFASFAPDKQNAIRFAISNGVTEALEHTFAMPPGGPGGLLLQFYKKVPEAALIHPFPRFLANSLKFLRDHSPFGVARFMTAGQREAVAKAVSQKVIGGGEFFYAQVPTIVSGIEREAATAIAKTFEGYLMLGTALAIRNSDMAGERWHDIKVGDRRIDVRPFNPLAAYLLLAEQMRQMSDLRTAAPIEVRDYADAFAGIRRLSGTGLFILSAFDQDVDSFKKGMERTARELIGGFTIPLRQLKDFLATVDEDEGVARSGEEAGLSGAALENIPFLSRALPEAARPTRPEPFGVEPDVGPFASQTVRQATGVGLTERTPLESELVLLDISAFPRTGDTQVNRLIAAEMGARMTALNSLVQSPTFQRRSRLEKRKILSERVSKIKSAAKSRVFAKESKTIIESIVEELKDKSRDEQREALAKRRRAGSINKALEAVILERLRRVKN